MRKRRWPLVLGGLVLVLGGAAAAGVLYLDALLLRGARDAAADLSKEWGRPVEVGDVSTTLFPRLGVEVTGLSVGAGPDEPQPLATVERAEVSVRVFPALRSRGKDIQVAGAEVKGAVVNVIRLKDGSQNVNRLLERIQASRPAEEEKPAAPDEEPADLSTIRVERAALTDAKIRFIDLGASQPRELEVSDLDVEVKDLRAGEPLAVALKAAVFAAAQNLEVELRAAPLPPTLVPQPERVVIKAKEIDLSPLGPFLGKDVGLERGTLNADWTADLGAAVPGGEGPTKLSGTLKVSRLEFAGTGGKALDVTVDTDVKADVAQGNLELDKLDVAVGPLEAHGKGKVQGLMSDAPRIQGLELSIPRFDPAELAAYVPAVKKALGDQAAGPASLHVRASGTAASPAVSLDADLTGMRLAVPKQLSKAAGAPMKISATVSGGKSALRFQADADLSGVDLRPGGDVAKPPGQPLAVSAKGTYAKQGETTRVAVDALRLDVLDQKVTGNARVDLAGKTTAVTAQLESPRLDLDQLLYEEPKAEGAPAEPPKPKDPRRFDGLRIDAGLKVGALRVEDMDLQNVRLEISMVDDAVTIKRFTAGMYGGEVVADGTSIKLGPVQRPFHAALKVRNVDMAGVVAAHSEKKFLAGRFTGDVAVDGVGTKLSALSETMAGNIDGKLEDGRLLGFDVFSGATGLLAKALPFASQALDNGNLTDLGEQLPFSVTVDKGVAQLKNPISFTRPQGSISLDGGARVDGTLNLAGTLSLSPETVAKITRGKATPTEPFPIPVKITGPAWKPHVAVVDLQKPAAALAKMAATAAAGKLLGERGKQIVDVVTGGQEKLKEEAEAKAKEEAEKAKQRLQEEAKKKLEEEAKKKLKGLFGQ